VKGLQNDIAVREWLPDQWYELALGEIPKAQVAEYCLYREFFRRPRRLNSLETLGLVALRYPRLERVPDAATQRYGGSLGNQWRAFLKLTLDFYVRAYSAVDIPTDFLRWLGVRVRKTYLIGPDATSSGRHQRLWPLIRGPGRRSRLVNILLAYLQLDPGDAEARLTVNDLLYAAWDTIAPMLKSYPDGRLLDLVPEASLTEVHEAWLYPVTRRILDTTLDGLTPRAERSFYIDAWVVRPESHALVIALPPGAMLFPIALRQSNVVSYRRCRRRTGVHRYELRRVNVAFDSRSSMAAPFGHCVPTSVPDGFVTAAFLGAYYSGRGRSCAPYGMRALQPGQTWLCVAGCALAPFDISSGGGGRCLFTVGYCRRR
jgi:hypothetical protein